MGKQDQRFRWSERIFLGVSILGLLLVGAYYVMDFFSIGKIGDPTDIGGGMMALAGYALAIVGLVGLLIAFAITRLRRD